jgi:hypothetical protein
VRQSCHYWPDVVRRKLAATTVALTFSILMAPFVIAVALGWAAHRSDGFRLGLGDTFDAPRMEHELDAIRTRFERQPGWPISGALGQRR